MKKPLKPIYWKCLVSFLAGAMLVLAFAPTKQFYFAVLAPAILYFLIEKATPKQAIALGACFGAGQFGAGVSWVFISINVYGFTPVPIALVFTALFVGFLSLYPMLQCYVLARYFPKESSQKLLLVFPLSWVLIEWLRSWLLTGFPWLLIAYSQVHGPLKGYVSVGGEYTVGFLVVFSSALLVYAIKNFPYRHCEERSDEAIQTASTERPPSGLLRRFAPRNDEHKRYLKFFGCMIIFFGIYLGGFLLSKIQWSRPVGAPVKVVLEQGNIAQSIKWQPGSVTKILNVYFQLTRENWQNSIIIWPEGAVPIPQNDATSFLTEMDWLAKAHHVTLFTGIPVHVPGTFNYYNALISLGDGSGYYYKRHLVPFGEYVPFANLLRGLMGFFSLPMSNMVPGPQMQPDLKANNIIFAPFICYEIAYARDLFREAAKAQVLLTVSDDAWFGDSLAPAQHLEIGQFRALESGRELLFDSNDGITAIVNDQGRIVSQIPQFTRGVLSGEFQPRTGKTPWLYYGNRPIILLMLLIFLILAIFERRKP